MKQKHFGTRFEDFLAEDGILEDCQAAAIEFKIADALKKSELERDLTNVEASERPEDELSRDDRPPE